MLVLHPRWAPRQIAAACLVVAVTAGCASTAAAPDALVAEPGAAAPAPADAPVAAPPADPEAPATYRPVVRPGKKAASVHAAAARLAAGTAARYPDGVTVTVERVAKSVEQGQGSGVFPGRPLTAVTLRLANGSALPVDLSQVVVTTTYGQRPRIATPVYETAEAQDFAGVVQPGADTTATYVFSIPPGQAKKVSTWVDFDAVHGAASFAGEVL